MCITTVLFSIIKSRRLLDVKLSDGGVRIITYSARLFTYINVSIREILSLQIINIRVYILTYIAESLPFLNVNH